MEKQILTNIEFRIKIDRLLEVYEPEIPIDDIAEIIRGIDVEYGTHAYVYELRSQLRNYCRDRRSEGGGR